MKKYAIIDIGSNTIRLCIYQVQGHSFKLVAKKRNVAGLAAYVDRKASDVNRKYNLQEEGIEKLISVLQDFKEVCKTYSVTSVMPIATASLRLISNARDVVNRVQKEVGFKIEILSGNEEATFSYAGARQGFKVNDGLLVDIGGASTELVYFKNQKVVKSCSMPIGSLNCYEKYVSRIIPTKVEQNRIRRDVLEMLDGISLPDSARGLTLCGVGGSVRNIGKLHRSLFNGNGENISYKDLKNILEHFKEEKKACLDVILKVAPHRIHTLVPGMVILKTIAKYFDCKDILVCKYGVREGYFVSQMQKETI